MYLGRNTDALSDLSQSIETLRGHEFIDYNQLGLDYRLLRSDVLYNAAVVAAAAGRMAEAKKSIDGAVACEQKRDATPIAEVATAIGAGQVPQGECRRAAAGSSFCLHYSSTMNR